MSVDFHQLRVLETREETGAGAKTLIFEVPDSLRDRFSWRPGQYLPLRFVLDGDELLRTYSISSSPFSGEPLQITVKRHAHGAVSRHLHDRVRTGDEIEAHPPAGAFCLDPSESKRRSHYLFGAGIGITPLFSMLHSVLLAEPHSFAHLIYSNRDAEAVIFRQALDELLERYPSRFTIDYAFSQSSPASSPGKPWREGRIDTAMVADFFADHPPRAQDTEHFVCGPGGMNVTVRRALMKLDVPSERIHLENFDEPAKIEAPYTSVPAKLQVRIAGESHDISVAANQTLLDAARDSGIEPPFSCKAGVCGACLARLVDGTVHHHATSALDAGQIDTGLILTCQAVATSKAIAIDYG